MKEKLEDTLNRDLIPIRFIETDFTGHSDGLSERRIRLPVNTGEHPEALEILKLSMIKFMLGFHVRQYLLRSHSIRMFGCNGWSEYSMTLKARFDDAGESVNAFHLLDDCVDRKKDGYYSVLTDQYESAPIEARIFVRPDSVVCEYQCIDKQRPDENKVLRDEVRIIARVTVPEKSVHVDFVLRNYEIKHAA